MNDTRRAVLDALADGPVSGPDLAETIGISRAAVWKHVEALREAGFEIEAADAGYVLADASGYSGPLIEYGLEAPFSIDFHEELDSTNRRARELAAEGAASDGRDVAVVAVRQTVGRGRLDREWNSPDGGIWTTILQRPAIPPAKAPLYTLAAAVAVTRTAREAGVDARIKWPNDVVVPADTDRGYRKLAGILTEMEGETDRIEWLACGIGVNANVDAASLPDGATSVAREADPVDRRLFLQTLLERFDERRQALGETIDDWRDHALTLGRRVRITRSGGDVVGTAVDVTSFGALVVETDDGDRVTVTAGDCEHLRPA
ncbi:biotin--[acetyl-CoA-carboxylase] ligase [Halovivax limisalsi]|uniref:biotin--[acetyl-CoA-carboxylase] ligase n=1 Tax=Halovivax limisalsi TaxID=1453760 RepID=UPI001FFCE862|nr:biotin--[acetyl-CoA-carboxylase] ligase [Halovivax limisalsi]